MYLCTRERSTESRKMIPIAKPVIGPEEKAAVLDVLESGQLAQGARVREFEEQFAAACGVSFGVATSSGTTALHVALLAHGIGPGDEVITSPFTFIASANAILYVGATPVFADIDPDDFTLRPEQVAAKITPRTRAILPVHLYGQPCDMPALMHIAAGHNLIVVEDACQAHGAMVTIDTDGSKSKIQNPKSKIRPVGSFGTGCFSFYPTKNMTTAEGGMITTNDPVIAERARMLRQHGARERYRHEVLGYNFRMTDVQAAIGLVQLSKLAEWTARRQANAAYLSQHLAGLEHVIIPRIRPGATHVFHQYTIRVLGDRDAFAARLRELGVETAVHYPLPVHQQPLYQRLGYGGAFPAAEEASRQVLSLPVHPLLSKEDLDWIVRAVRAVSS